MKHLQKSKPKKSACNRVTVLLFSSITIGILYYFRSYLSFSDFAIPYSGLRSDIIAIDEKNVLLTKKSPKPLKSLQVFNNITKSGTTQSNSIFKSHIARESLASGVWNDFDPNVVSNMTWDYMIGILGIKSVLDIGCGRGYSTNYFYRKGLKVLCIEGSHEAIETTFLPSQQLIVEHDFTRGPYWPDQTFDACWSIEFLEHISRQYFKNYIHAFKKCAIVFVTASAWGGYHHVEVHAPYWWKGRFISAGMTYFPDLTDVIKKTVSDEKEYLKEKLGAISRYDARIGPIGQHINQQMMVFINPLVASLPEHDHLFSGDGCYMGPDHFNANGGVPCEGLDQLPNRYNSLMRCYKDLNKMKEINKSVGDMYWTCLTQPNQNGDVVSSV